MAELNSALLTALALVLIIEGLLPFLSPRLARHLWQQLLSVSHRTLRLIGLFSMIAGVIFLYLVH
jgi:uncharacterized protein YjeT (DUF2065 family)